MVVHDLMIWHIFETSFRFRLIRCKKEVSFKTQKTVFRSLMIHSSYLLRLMMFMECSHTFILHFIGWLLFVKTDTFRGSNEINRLKSLIQFVSRESGSYIMYDCIYADQIASHSIGEWQQVKIKPSIYLKSSQFVLFHWFAKLNFFVARFVGGFDSIYSSPRYLHNSSSNTFDVSDDKRKRTFSFFSSCGLIYSNLCVEKSPPRKKCSSHNACIHFNCMKWKPCHTLIEIYLKQLTGYTF